MDVIAVVDVGKTNKKFFLFDTAYRLVWQEEVVLPEIMDEDGFACDDLTALTAWFTATLQKVTAIKDFCVKAINFSSYGASLVPVDATGRPVTPLYNYLKPVSEVLRQQFDSYYGYNEALAAATASPLLGNLNAGLQLFGLKYQKPQLFAQVHRVLHLPQYFSFLVTGQMLSEYTSIGCHTLLWHFEKGHYHPWVTREGLNGLLPALADPDTCFRVALGSHTVWVGTGLHDSSAALIPYLNYFTEPFALISTGTWSITLNPFNNDSLTPQELEQDCLCYLTYGGKPVKASRLFLGHLHQGFTEKLATHFGCAPHFYREVGFDPALVILKQQPELETIFTNLPHTLEVAGFASPAQAYHALIQYLVGLQVASAKLVLQNTPVQQVVVDGGFGQNPVFMHLLACALPGYRVFAAEVSQATALGAAIVLNNLISRQLLHRPLLKLIRFYGSVPGFLFHPISILL